MTKPRAYLVTGASNGIGAAIAALLLAQGHTVLNVDLKAPATTPEGMVVFEADLTNEQQTKDIAARLASEYAIVGLVNNAGATRPGTAETATLEALDFVCNLHLKASLIFIQAALPAMKEAGFGRIVMLASRAALGKPNRVVYSATKAGMIGMARTLAMELGVHGITVNSIAPGPIATELFMSSNPADAPATKAIINSTVCKRLGTPEDVARAAGFFLDEANGFVTGQVMYVCGGTTLGIAPG
jgi:NAD(P)-dependent dehydrogenase (short-subunit alcohol dehydrogenase family)